MKDSPEILARVKEIFEIMQNGRLSEHRARDLPAGRQVERKARSIARTWSDSPARRKYTLCEALTVTIEEGGYR